MGNCCKKIISCVLEERYGRFSDVDWCILYHKVAPQIGQYEYNRESLVNFIPNGPEEWRQYNNNLSLNHDTKAWFFPKCNGHKLPKNQDSFVIISLRISRFLLSCATKVCVPFSKLKVSSSFLFMCTYFFEKQRKKWLKCTDVDQWVLCTVLMCAYVVYSCIALRCASIKWSNLSLLHFFVLP